MQSIERRRSGSFIEGARRSQLVDAAIAVLVERGFAATSLAAVADSAGVSKGVISYHFAGKDELLREVVVVVLRRAAEWMTSQARSATSFGEALETYIRSNIAYLDGHRDEIFALTEVLANARATSGVEQLFRESRDEAVGALSSVFTAGAAAGEFATIPARSAAIALRAAIDAASSSMRADPEFDPVAFGEDLVDLWKSMVAR